MAEGIQKRLQGEIEKYKTVQKDLQKSLVTRQQLDSQLNENKLVLDEMKRLDGDSHIYKLIGPVLVKQDQDEAKQNVQKRIDYINTELKRQDVVIKDLEKKQEAHRDTLGKLQSQLQQQQVKAAVKA